MRAGSFQFYISTILTHPGKVALHQAAISILHKYDSNVFPRADTDIGTVISILHKYDSNLAVSARCRSSSLPISILHKYDSNIEQYNDLAAYNDFNST